MKKILCSLLLLCVGTETAFASNSGARKKERSSTKGLLSRGKRAQLVAEARRKTAEENKATARSQSKSPAAKSWESVESVDDEAERQDGSGPGDLQQGDAARGWKPKFLKKKQKKELVSASVDSALIAHEDVAHEADKEAGDVSALGKQSAGQSVGCPASASKLDQLPGVDGEVPSKAENLSDNDEEADGAHLGRTDLSLLPDTKEKDHDEVGGKEKEKKLMQAGSSSFSQALTGFVTAGFGYVVTALVHDRGGLPGLGVLAGGMTVPFVLKKTGIIAKKLDETEKAALYGLLAGAGIYTGIHSTKYVPALRLPEFKLPTFRFSDVSQNVVARFT